MVTVINYLMILFIKMFFIGYVSHNDFISKLSEMCILDKEEIPYIVKHLDPENKGHVNFAEFSKKIRPNMTQQDENGNPTVLPYVSPSKEINMRITQELPEVKHKITELKRSFTSTPSTGNLRMVIKCLLCF